MSKNNFDAIADALGALDSEIVSQPSIPVSIAVQETENLSVWAKKDWTVLKNVGLSKLVIDSLVIRAGALRYIQAEWISEKELHTEYTRQWQEISPRGYELQSEMAHSFRFAFYGNNDLLSRVREISRDSGHADMIQDLMSYSELGKDNLSFAKESRV